MKKQLLLSVLFTLTFFFETTAQSCLPDGITFSSQTQMDSFPIYYPGCIIIEGKVIISGNDISDLTGLADIQKVAGLLIKDNSNLTSLTGLENLQEVDNCSYPFLIIENNDALTNLEGLNNLSSVKSRLEIVDNDGLTNLAGLETLDTIYGCGGPGPGSGGTSVLIESNDNLGSLIGLQGLRSVHLIHISDNDNLYDLGGMENLDTLEGLIIENQDPFYNLQGLPHIELLRSLTLKDNSLLHTLEGVQNIGSLDRLAIINNDSLINLQGLPYMDSLSALILQDNNLLYSLEGIQNIGSLFELSIINNDTLLTLGDIGTIRIDSSAGRIIISDNELLTSVEGLNGLEVVGELEISDNPSLTSLEGLETLKIARRLGCCSRNCGNPSYGCGDVRIQKNDVLVDLSGLDNIQWVERWLDIIGNDNLVTLSGLNSLVEIGPSSSDGIWLEDNSLLSDCAIPAICNLIPWIVSVENNTIGCNSIAEVEFLCSPMSPVAPLLIAPLDSATGLPLNNTLMWTYGSFTESYTVQVSTDSDFLVDVVETMDLTMDTLITLPLNANTTYFWRVKAFNPVRESVWSDVWRFTTGVMSGVEDVTSDSFIELYPNPTSGQVRIPLMETSDFQSIQFYSSIGQMIKEMHYPEQTIDVSDIPSGFYVVILASENKSFFGKLVIE